MFPSTFLGIHERLHGIYSTENHCTGLDRKAGLEEGVYKDTANWEPHSQTSSLNAELCLWSLLYLSVKEFKSSSLVYYVPKKKRTKTPQILVDNKAPGTPQHASTQQEVVISQLSPAQHILKFIAYLD